MTGIGDAPRDLSEFISWTRREITALKRRRLTGGITSVDWDDILDKPATFPPSTHTQPFSTITGEIADAQLPARIRANVGVLGTVDLDTVIDSGWYVQQSSASATPERHYPELIAGFLEVIRTGSFTVTQVGILQRYTAYNDPRGHRTWARIKYTASTWSGWNPIVSSSGISGATETSPGVAELATAAEVQAGTDTTRIVTPAGLAARQMSNANMPLRLREFAQTITDWNQALTNGWYMASGAANAPAAGWWLGWVEAHNGVPWVTQTVHAFTSDSAANTQIWRRACDNGTWGAWYKLQWSQLEQDLRYAARVTDPTQWVGHLGEILTVPTHISTAGGQTTHPSVLYFPGAGWNGYRYWMAHTPYPFGNDDHEDPNIVASHDGINWVIPAGLTNPLDDASGTPYNSDVELVMAADGVTMMCVWRWYDSGLGTNQERLYMRTSTNGTTWTTKVLIHQSTQTDLRMLSPTLVYEDGAWSLWGVDMQTTPNRLVRRRSNSAVLSAATTWSAVQACTIDYMESGKEAWHIQIRKVGEQYVALLNNCTLNASGTNGNLFLMTSDDGIAWESSRTPTIPSRGSNHDALYRASLVPRVDGHALLFDVWYAAWTQSTSVWEVFKTVVGPAQIVEDDTGWVTITPPSGGTALDGFVTQIRRVGREVEVRVQVTMTLASAGTYFFTGIPREFWPPDMVRAGILCNGYPGYAQVYPRGHANAGQMLVQHISGANRTWASGRFSYRLG